MSDANLGWVKVVDWTAAGAAATQPIVLTAYATAKRIRIDIVDGVVATDDSALLIRTSTDGGSSYDSGAGTYHYNVEGRYGAATSFARGAAATSILTMIETAAASAIGNASTEGFSASFILANPSGTALYKAIDINVNWLTPGTVSGFSRGVGYHLAATDVDAIQFLCDTGGNLSFTYAVFAEF